MLKPSEQIKAKKTALKELSSIQLFVKNGVLLYSKGSSEEKTADEELVRAALTSIENMPLTQSGVAILISALHKFAVESKWDCLIDMA